MADFHFSMKSHLRHFSLLTHWLPSSGDGDQRRRLHFFSSRQRCAARAVDTSITLTGADQRSVGTYFHLKAAFESFSHYLDFRRALIALYRQ